MARQYHEVDALWSLLPWDLQNRLGSTSKLHTAFATMDATPAGSAARAAVTDPKGCVEGIPVAMLEVLAQPNIVNARALLQRMHDNIKAKEALPPPPPAPTSEEIDRKINQTLETLLKRFTEKAILLQAAKDFKAFSPADYLQPVKPVQGQPGWFGTFTDAAKETPVPALQWKDYTPAEWTEALKRACAANWGWGIAENDWVPTVEGIRYASQSLLVRAHVAGYFRVQNGAADYKGEIDVTPYLPPRAAPVQRAVGLTKIEADHLFPTGLKWGDYSHPAWRSALCQACLAQHGAEPYRENEGRPYQYDHEGQTRQLIAVAERPGFYYAGDDRKVLDVRRYLPTHPSIAAFAPASAPQEEPKMAQLVYAGPPQAPEKTMAIETAAPKTRTKKTVKEQRWRRASAWA